ncbi:beta-ketoacyl synthase N-terminal-like domain-containing protein [Pendulispora albinea]|uniref:SDR family NAD(P)-dependent oxidoreductase n=1 Tax=Pendulispora albinea TaxID=2741071 RepID=A0ABZ2LSP9_9BACT
MTNDVGIEETDRMSTTAARNGLELAIIGMAGRFPGAPDVDTFWRNLRDGVESIDFLGDDLEPNLLEGPEVRRDPKYVRAAPILDGVERFDASFFGVTPKEAELMDPQQRIFLECAWEALEQAGYAPGRFRGRIGVYGGSRTNTYVFNLFSNPRAVGSLGAFEVALGNDLAFLSTRVSHRLNLRGPSYSLQTACSTGLVTVHVASQALLAGECDIALAGAVAISVPQRTGYLHEAGSIMSPDGHCRAFDAKAGGTIFGSGVGLVVLKRLDDALADGDTIHAVVKGSAMNNDGDQKASFTAPGVPGQTRVIRDALAVSEVDARSITYVEAHGSGTPLGDPIEVRALTRAFRATTNDKRFCALGSVKTNVGHLDAAAGIAGLIKAVFALRHRQIPATLHFETPNPQLDLEESPFFVNDVLRDWESGPHPRRAGVSSFGIGGTNVHVILEEAPPEPPTAPSDADPRPQVLVLSAKTETALEAATGSLANAIEARPDVSLEDIAHTLQVGREIWSHRRALVGRDRAHALRLLRGEEPERVHTAFEEARNRPTAFLFPGTGAQYAGMAAGLYETEPVFREELQRVSALFQRHLPLDLRALLYPGPQVQARDVEGMAIQPAIFAVEYALARLMLSWGIEPDVMLGHSLGEYTAACLAEVLSLEDAVRLVALRAECVETLPEGAMLSVALPERELAALLGPLALAAVNAPAQCVVSGPRAEVEALRTQLGSRGIEHRLLQVDRALHSHMLDPILERFRDGAARVRFQAPKRRYISSVTGHLAGAEVATPEFWVQHLRQTVRFADAMRELLAEPARVLLEIGPGQTLTALSRLQSGDARQGVALASTRHPKDKHDDAFFLRTTLAKAWLAGIDVDWSAVHGRERRRVPLPTYPFEREHFWVPPGELGGGESTLSSGKLSNLAKWFHVASWRRTPMPPLEPGALSSPRGWVVFTDGGALGASLIGRLERAGHEVVTVAAGTSFSVRDDRHFTIAPAEPEHYTRLLAALRGRASAPRPEVFVHLWSLTPSGDGPSDPDSFAALQARGYYSLLRLGQALAASGQGERVQLEVVSNELHDFEGEGGPRPEKAPLLGVCKVLPQERPHTTVRCIDIALPAGHEDANALAEQLVAEIHLPFSDLVVAHRGARRFVQSFTSLPLEGDVPPRRPLRKGGVYLITGGLGGVGLLLAEYLAETFQARLILLGRTPLPPRDGWSSWLATKGEEDRQSRILRRLLAMEEKGAEVSVASVDVADAPSLREAIDRAESRFGPLNGVLHAAGLTQGESVYRPLTEIGDIESEAQFRPKVHGTYALESALGGRPVDFVLLFSSSSAILGGLGYVAYSASNSFLDAFAARASRRGDARWVSVNWDSWSSETKHYAVRTTMDRYAMTRDESTEAFRRLVTAGVDGQVVAITGDLDARLALWIRQGTSGGRNAPTPQHSRRARTTFVAPEGETEQTIAAIWQETLGGAPVGRHDDFFDLGGHSLLATQVLSRMRAAFDIEIPLVKLFESPTAAGLARVVAEARADADAHQEAEQRLLREIVALSDEEIDLELEKHRIEETSK